MVSYFFNQAQGSETVAIAAAVSPRDCALCHLDRFREFTQSKHANTIEIVRRTDPWLKEGHLSPIVLVTGCEDCHGTGLGVETSKFESLNLMGRGIGRIKEGRPFYLDIYA